MALPNPIPDNPLRWDGWKNYNSDDFYARLCLSYESNPSPEHIEENCRQLLVWWQKKLPLKNQPSNPISQILRGGLDDAPAFLAEARTKLLDAEARSIFDHELHARIVAEALSEFKKLLSFALGDNRLREEDEQRLYERGRGLGLSRDDMKSAIDAELARAGAERIATPVFVPPPLEAPRISTAPRAAGEVQSPEDEFRRMLRLSRLCLEGEEMTDDQRDALCNMGEGLGMTGGQAEDLIDEYLDEASSMPSAPLPSRAPAAAARPSAPSKTNAPAPPKKSEVQVRAAFQEAAINTSPLARVQERQKFANFTNPAGIEMLLVPSGVFFMGSVSHEAMTHEQPVTQVSLSCFYLGRFPVTNAQFEKYDHAHVSKRAPWADGNHPAVYVNSREAEKFCAWLSAREGKKYRLPTEAEWEYAARGMDGRAFPWGDNLDAGHLANFADKRTMFAWRDATIDDGFAETAAIGNFPRGVSPFGIEEMAGNVFEWCLDFFENYKGKERVNPRGASGGSKRIYRGGSWKSRAANLRATARNFNAPDYSSNDVGFRVACECEA